MATFDVNPLIDATLTHAAAYIADPTKQGALFPNTLEIDNHVAITAAYAKGYAHLSQTIGSIITHFANKDGLQENGQLTYLSGANGAKQLLMDAVKDPSNTSPHIAALREAVAAGVQFDFQEAKGMFTKQTGESLEGYQYAKFRPLLSGIDRAITDYARAHQLNRVNDSVVPVIPEGTPDNKVHVFAIALTPEQAVAEAAKIGINADEAAQNAQRFAAFFSDARKGGADITLLDEKLNPIFVRKNGKEETVGSEMALCEWQFQTSAPANDSLPNISARAREACVSAAR